MSIRSEFIRLWNEFTAQSKKISELPNATTPLGGTELVEVVQGGVNKKVASSNLGGGGGGTQDLQSVLTQGSVLSSDANIDDTDSTHNFNLGVGTPFQDIILQAFRDLKAVAQNEAWLHSGASGLTLHEDGDSLVFEDNRAIPKGLEYLADYSANYTNRSLVDKAYVNSLVAGLLDLKGDTDASANPNYPSASKGDAYYVTVAGKIGGASGKSVDIGDVYVAKADNAGGTEASVGTSWFVLEHNLAGVLLLTGGTMSGNIAMGGNKVTGLAAASGNGEAVRYEQLILKADLSNSFNRQTASYTLVLSDAGKIVEQNVGSANNLTVPLNASVAFPIGTDILINQYGAGQTTIVATGGVTLRSKGGALKISAQYSGAALTKVGTDEWYVQGDLTT